MARAVAAAAGLAAGTAPEGAAAASAPWPVHSQLLPRRHPSPRGSSGHYPPLDQAARPPLCCGPRPGPPPLYAGWVWIHPGAGSKIQSLGPRRGMGVARLQCLTFRLQVSRSGRPPRAPTGSAGPHAGPRAAKVCSGPWCSRCQEQCRLPQARGSVFCWVATGASGPRCLQCRCLWLPVFSG